MAPQPRPLTDSERYRYLKEHRALIKKIGRGPVIKKITGTLVLVEGENLLTIDERRLVVETLRLAWLPKDKLRKHWQLQKLKHIEATRKIAKAGVPHGERTDFISALTGYDDTDALRQFARRARKRRRR
jgi:hypothetical protein